MQDQFCLITKCLGGHSDVSQSRRCRPPGLPGGGGPGLWHRCLPDVPGPNLVYIEKSDCLQDTASVSPSPSLSFGVMFCRSAGSPGTVCAITRGSPSPKTAPSGGRISPRPGHPGGQPQPGPAVQVGHNPAGRQPGSRPQEEARRPSPAPTTSVVAGHWTPWPKPLGRPESRGRRGQRDPGLSTDRARAPCTGDPGSTAVTATAGACGGRGSPRGTAGGHRRGPGKARPRRAHGVPVPYGRPRPSPPHLPVRAALPSGR